MSMPMQSELGRAAISTAALLLLASVPAGWAQDPPQEAAAELVRRAVDAVPKVAFEADAVLTAPGGFTRDLELLHKPMGGADATYIEVTAPLNLKGARFLFLERTSGADEQFIYVPALKRTVQVLEDARKQPFLGSDFYVSDLVAPDVDAYHHVFAGAPDTKIGERHCKLVESTPKNPQGEIYGKAVFAIDPIDLLVMRSEFFDPKGVLLKVWTLDRVEKIDGFWTPMLQKMVNVQQSSESVLETKRVRYNAEISDQVFTKSHLQR